MMKEVLAQELEPGDRVALPFNKRATVKSTKVGYKFVTVEWEEPYMDSRYGFDQPVLLEGPEDA